jgi:two-component system sensor histidine kinase/response regulator
MTANAMEADLDACLAAGMNDHVTKPIDRKTLLATLRRWLPAKSPAPAVAARETPADQGPPLEGIDVPGAVQRLGIDRAAFEPMLLRFAQGQRSTLAALRAAVDAHDPVAAARHAHAIAGSAGSFGADALRAAAAAVEQAGREGRRDLAELYAAVEAQAAIVTRSIDTLQPAATRAADGAGPSFDRAAAAGALDRLASSLDNYDVSSAGDALAALESAGLRARAPEDLQRLRHLVDEYEYAEAQALASRILTRINDGELTSPKEAE